MYIALIIGLVVIVAYAIWASKGRNPAVFAERIAKNQYSILMRTKTRNPQLSGRELYIEVLSFHPAYGRVGAERLIKEAEEIIKNSPFEVNHNRILKFCDVVQLHVIEEFIKVGGNLDDQQFGGRNSPHTPFRPLRPEPDMQEGMDSIWTHGAVLAFVVSSFIPEDV